MQPHTLRILFSLAASLFFIVKTQAQTERPRPSAASMDAAPWWAQQMYSDRPNVFAVDSAFVLWRKDNPLGKTYHTQFYKHWRRAIGSQLTEDGYWNPPTPEAAAADARLWADLKNTNGRATNWESLGPFVTYAEGSTLEVSWQANVYCLDQSPSHPNTLYCGTEGGSIFKSTDNANNWACVSDGLALDGITALKVHPADPNTAYFGQGNNLYKTVDGGTTWTTVLTSNNLNARDISINPGNPQILLVAGQNGLHRSTDGGANWSQLFTQGCWDIEIKTNDANTVFLLKTNPSTKVCEFFKSTDMGATWTLKSSGWIDASANSVADNNDGGARLAVTDADPNRIYAVLLGQYNDGVNDNNYLGVYRSNDAGETWTLPNANANGGPGGPYAGNHTCLVTFWFNNAQQYPNAESEYDQGFYNLGLDVSDTDPDDFLVGFLNLFKSEDGGTTFQRWGGYGGGPGWQHPDIQDIDINGNDVWVSSDGGINLYAADYSSHAAKNLGIAASDFWGFDGGWNEDVMTGGRYHNGNTATIYGTYPNGQFIRLGGAEATTGFVHPSGGRKVMHSDIDPKVLPTTVHGPTSGFSFNAYPNEGYAGNNENSSEIEPDPRCYNHLYIGSENTLQKSEDGGISWATRYTFGSDATDLVTGIEVSRSNPDVIYLIQNAGPSKLWKSTDGGLTFSSSNLPPGAVEGAFIALSATDENKIWLAWNRGGNNGNKVFESSDGGASWTNLTSTTLNGHHVEQLIHISGTDDGLYLATNFGVFYRSDSEADWQPCSNNLPAKAKINRLVPFYAKNKVRIATYHRGIWQADFEENPTQPIVQPTVDKLEASCARDTFFFDDYSIVNHSGATWAWAFDPAPQWVEATNIRNPKVVFGTPGTYTATMTLNGAFTKSLTLQVSSGCDAETVPGQALSLSPSGYAIANGNLNLNTNNFTLSCWIKAAELQNDRAVFAFFRGGSTTTGLGFSTGRKLSYHWDGSQWWWDPNVTVPADTWTHIALVVTPTAATIYMNGIGVTNSTSHSAEAFDTPLYFGWDTNSSARRFTGEIDEVTIWNKALSQNEVRELMHLTHLPADQPNLVSYYQFNEPSGQILDRVSTRHAPMGGSAERVISSAPVGGGTSARMTVNSGGAYTFGSTGVTMTFPASGTYPNGELCVSRLNLDPDQLPSPTPNGDAYWVVNNYGTNATFSQLSAIRFDDYGDVPQGIGAADFMLYKRSSFADGDTWGSAIDLGDEVVHGPSGSVTFSTNNSISSFSQLIVTQEIGVPVEWQDFRASLQRDHSVLLQWTVAQTPDVSHFTIEKSTNGIDFQPLGTLPAKAGAGTFKYEAVDSSPAKGLNYYRLRQVDLDGSIDYSLVRSVVVNALADTWAIFPNPISAHQALEIRTDYQDEYRFQLYDAKGRVVFSKELQGNATLEGMKIGSGVYGYQIIAKAGRVMGKLVVE
jgi:photosystem II stability/assembly factor-like uncharacterized protein